MSEKLSNTNNVEVYCDGEWLHALPWQYNMAMNLLQEIHSQDQSCVIYPENTVEVSYGKHVMFSDSSYSFHIRNTKTGKCREVRIKIAN